MSADFAAGHAALLAVLGALSDGLIVLDRERRFLYVNHRAEQMIRRSGQDLLGRVIWDEFPDAAGSIFHEQYEAALRDQRAVEFEGYYGPLNLHLHVRANPTESGLAILLQDIASDRRSAAEQRLWADAFAHAVAGIAITDPATNTIRTANAAYLAMHGYTLPQVTGLPLLATYAPEERARALEFLAQADQAGRASFESVHVRQDGHRFPVQMDIITIHDAAGRPSYRVTNVQDLTRRRQVEAERAATADLLRSAVDIAGGPLFLKDRNSRYVLVNNATAAALRQPDAGAVEGRYDHELVPPDAAAALVAADQRVIATGQPEVVEEQITDGSGETRCFLVTKVPWRNAAGETVGVHGSGQDITERKRAEQALREREGRYHLVMRATNDVLWDWNLATSQVDWSPSLHDRFGYDWRAVDPNAVWWQDHIHPDDRQRVLEHIHAALAGAGENWCEEYRFRRADGSFADVLDRGFIARDQTGRAVRMVGSMLDLTERNRREAERRRTEHLLDAVLDALPVAIIIANAAGQIVRMNRASDRIWGRAPHSESVAHYGEWIGYWPATGRRVEAHEWPLARAVQHGEISNAEIYEIQPFDGGPRRTIEISAGPVRDEAGQLLGAVVACMDITERAAAERAVRASEATLNAVLDAMPVGVIIAGADGGLLRDNAAHRDIWGVSPATANWEQYGDWIGFWPDTGQRIQAAEWGMARALLQGETIKGELVEYQPFGSGERGYLLNNAAPIYDSSGKLIAAVVAELEVTKQRETEQALRQLNTELEHFAWAASHDLQEPLRMVTTYSQLLTRRSQAQLDAESLQYLQIMNGSVAQMRRLIADLQVYLEAGQEPPEPRLPAALSAACRRAEENLRPLVQDSGAVITYGPLPAVLGREAQLVRVFEILFANAIHHSRRGIPPTIHVAAVPSGVDCLIRVRDNGVGIPAEHRERIFGVFKRLTRSVPGTGMGLAICRKIIAAHGGSIWVEASDGPGSTFCFRLPSGEPNGS